MMLEAQTGTPEKSWVYVVYEDTSPFPQRQSSRRSFVRIQSHCTMVQMEI